MVLEDTDALEEPDKEPDWLWVMVPVLDPDAEMLLDTDLLIVLQPVEDTVLVEEPEMDTECVWEMVPELEPEVVLLLLTERV